jgi:signal peptidase II
MTQREPALRNGHLVAIGAVALIIGATFLADQVTKWLVVSVVMQPPRTIPLLPFFNLSLGFNSGISFGLFADVFASRPALLAGIKMLIVAVLVIWACRSADAWERLGLAMIAGGALGNIVDRMRHGAVTDFLDFHWAGMHWPTFNVADVAISLGAATLIVSAIFAPANRSPA